MKGLFGTLVVLLQLLSVEPKENYTALSKTLSRFGGPRSQVKCTEGFNQGGNAMVLVNNAANLGQFSFDNRASSCCFTGIWILYDLPNYNALDFNAIMYTGWGENMCTNFDGVFNKRASSARVGGAPDGYKYNTLNIFQGPFFMGDEQFFYSDSAQFPVINFGQSLLVTGCSPWTVYQFPNFQGASVCFMPQNTQSCAPGFFPNAGRLGGLAGQMSSARMGCYSGNVATSQRTEESGWRVEGDGKSTIHFIQLAELQQNHVDKFSAIKTD
ncbi:hypothetical protein TCAL_03749 [Tigriopus californicus]|uniref:Beta/gamma crystallin 'Greek key' domain-containing protein n=1 Tax=Tigriopus californicus TaxID=6832 RepID=A0A553NNJ0_TIGCA|nr:uncharacterized protein LOC131879441 [Tigriopus californicus]TRY66957.1 hypothetical protein TCAL_03749 [Tigriopus californicus]|eukprot:TCALIF_03749-PA protein Name:"Protein of unknown function" AED:0.14 eAED:0.14 QI:102/1/0.83/1/0.2/0.5/6/0/269